MDNKFYKKLCELYSTSPFFLDETQSPQPLSPKLQIEFARAFGIDCSNEETIDSSLLNKEQRHWQEILPPSQVTDPKSPLVLEVKLPETCISQTVHWLLQEENDQCHKGEFIAARDNITVRKQIATETYIAVQSSLSLTLPLGYHTLKITCTSSSGHEYKATSTIIVTPYRCYIPPSLESEGRVWGITCQLDNIQSRRNWGVGDFTDLRELLSWTSQHGAGTLRIHSLQSWSLSSSHQRYFKQFYSLSYFSPLYLDPETIEDFQESEEAEKLFQSPSFKMKLSTLRDKRTRDFDEVAATKKEMFEILWRSFQENHLNPDTERGHAFRLFQKTEGNDLLLFSAFELLSHHFQTKGMKNWQSWPKEFQDAHSEAVTQFIIDNKERLEFCHYLQWQTKKQLTAIGRRSMELGLKVGLLNSLPASLHKNSYEVWAYPKIFAMNMVDVSTDGNHFEADGCSTPPLLLPYLYKSGYRPFIASLQANMDYAGALCIPYQLLTSEHRWLSQSSPAPESIHFQKHPIDLLGVVALESQRKKCLVICEHPQNISQEQLAELHSMNILSSCPGHFQTNKHGDWLPPDRYSRQSVITTSNSRLAALSRYWKGSDIDIHCTMHPQKKDAWHEEKIIARAASRAHLLISLHRQNLLPEGFPLDPQSITRLSPELLQAVHLYLGTSRAQIYLLPMEDLPCLRPTLDDDKTTQPEWKITLSEDIETIQKAKELRHVFNSLCRERGIGVVRPSALLNDRRKNKRSQIPRAFYRLQLNGNFTFQEAANVVPYLAELGISHCYMSPCLTAKPGSPHGYDIIDHSSLNPEIGSRENFEKFAGELTHYGMAQIFDIVPNHMGVGSDNGWWLDVLENGPSSHYADFFDINWHPQQQELQGRILLPVLGDHYGTVLETGQLRLTFNSEMGNFFISYYEHFFPLAPRTYPFILDHDLQRLEEQLGSQHDGFLQLQNLISSFRNLPDRYTTQQKQLEMRSRNKEVLKRLLARLCKEVPVIETFIKENVILFNGSQETPESFNSLHQLLSLQAYRLSYWRVASDEINYRRFFDINDLAGIRMENQRVFEETHSFIIDLIATGKVDGLRIDHPDGLYAPGQYFDRLQAAAKNESTSVNKNDHPSNPSASKVHPLYVVVEKILADFECLPENWAVHGTTGYDYAFVQNGLFIEPSSQKALTKIYSSFINQKIDFSLLVYNCKKKIIKTSMAGELNVLAEKLNRLAKLNRHTQDFTLNSIRDALIEFVAYFPVYRTYINSESISKNDRKHIEWAIAKAKTGKKSQDITIYNFLKQILLGISQEKNDTLQYAAKDFVLRLQQYTGPVMAKGLEDTAFYIYNRLLSLNDVGGDPCRFGISPAEFHQSNLKRSTRWPHSMLNTSSHDSKRSEDVRARINVLSEITTEWHQAVKIWKACNNQFRTKLENDYAPSRNDEYAFYQNLLGVWPLCKMNQEETLQFTERVEQYMIKAIREAKVHTSWINPNPAYESAMSDFVRNVITENTTFLEEFIPFQKKTTWFGMLNSLSQLLLKLTVPGIPDIYQGNEIWLFNLVDPDNRRLVDFSKRKALLDDLKKAISVPREILPDTLGQLMGKMYDSRIKLYTLYKTLNFRKQQRDIFELGEYVPLHTQGPHEKHIFAFMRRLADRQIIVVVTRLAATLLAKKAQKVPTGDKVWGTTLVILPENTEMHTYQNLFTGELIETKGPKKNHLYAAELFSTMPISLLTPHVENNTDTIEKEN